MIACHRKIIQIILASNIARVQIPWGCRFFLISIINVDRFSDEYLDRGREDILVVVLQIVQLGLVGVE